MDALPQLLARADVNANCTKETCPVKDSVYGYYPDLGATSVFMALFALSGIAYVYQGYRTKTWFFTSVMCIGALSEVLGYVAKYILRNNPFSDLGFKMSVVLLTFAPAFYSAGIYYTLKHICLTFGASFSRIQPYLYTWIFVTCDFIAIMLQAAGGAIASAGTTESTVHVGNHFMLAGLAFQVATLLAFGVLAADYGVRVFRKRHALNPSTAKLRSSRQFQFFIGALWLAWVCIEIRCTYRVAELAKGWRNNPIIQDQDLFIALDSLPVGLAALALNLFHPGYCFPKESRGANAVGEKTVSGNTSDADA